MSGDWKTAAEWAAEGLAGLPGTRQGVEHTAKQGDWRTHGVTHARKRKGRGGGWEYHVSCLPDAAQADRARRQRAALATDTATREEAKPAIKDRLDAADAALRLHISVLDEAITELTRRRDAARALLGDQA